VRWASPTIRVEASQAITLYKNNSDGKGNSYGTHENYLVRRDVEFAHLIRAMVPHFVSRQVVVGAGKVGAETEAGLDYHPSFQLSQRAEFFDRGRGFRDHAEATDYQHPRRTPQRRRAIPAPARDYW